ncbi:hypothetical protein BKA61DRAFT_668217 [Leptodontidium sp. MPI-SDFR-AT-0119]|nr:hypothetical protein BKA61DRAFT_668217 [Leptodontidium sp. MPI-SDFR-AT-0119]
MKFLDLNNIKNFLMGRQASTPGVAGHHVDSAIDMTMPPAGTDTTANYHPGAPNIPARYRGRTIHVAVLILAFCLIILPSLIAIQVLTSRAHQSNAPVDPNDPSHQPITHL